MAIGIHIAHTTAGNESNAWVERVADDSGSVPNTANSPTVDEYLALEAGDDYLPCVVTPTRIVTASVSDINGA